ncbi:unnamed protein product [Symbiodinium sp. CCMP2456]|nr:unnamed protein product [Symbiodinium sp. CCMP2456]
MNYSSADAGALTMRSSTKMRCLQPSAKPKRLQRRRRKLASWPKRCNWRPARRVLDWRLPRLKTSRDPQSWLSSKRLANSCLSRQQTQQPAVKVTSS